MSRGFGTTFGSGSTDIIQTGFTTQALQRTYALWTYRNGDGGGGFGRIFDKSDTAIEVLYNNSGGFYEFLRGWSGSLGDWQVTRPSSGGWVHVALSYDGNSSSNSPVIYYDGVSQSVSLVGSPSGTISTNALDYDIGNRSSDSARNWDGMLAEWAVWDAILTAEEVAALGKGASPLFIRTGALANYRPLVSDTQDLRTGAAATVTGTLVKPHPRIYQPRRNVVFFAEVAGGNQTIAVPAGSLVLTGNAPTVTASDHQTVAVPAGALTLTGNAPTVTASDHQTVAVPAGALTLTGNAPTVLNGDNQVVNVPAAALTLTGNAPTVAVSDHQVIGVPAASLTLQAFAPVVTATANQTIIVPAGALVLTGYAPAVDNGTGVTIAVPVGLLVMAAQAPVVVSTTAAGLQTGSTHAPRDRPTERRARQATERRPRNRE